MNRSKVLTTFLVLVLACGIVYWFFGKNIYFLVAAGILAAIGLLLPGLAEKIHWAWMRFGEAIGFVMSKVILTIVFILLLIPIAMMARLFRKKTVALKNNAKTYFKDRNFTYNKESMENPW